MGDCEEVDMEDEEENIRMDQHYMHGSLLHNAQKAGLFDVLLNSNDKLIIKTTKDYLDLTRNTSKDVKRLMHGKLRTILGYYIILL